MSPYWKISFMVPFLPLWRLKSLSSFADRCSLAPKREEGAANYHYTNAHEWLPVHRIVMALQNSLSSGDHNLFIREISTTGKKGRQKPYDQDDASVCFQIDTSSL
jgi:hypothetical protein